MEMAQRISLLGLLLSVFLVAGRRLENELNVVTCGDQMECVPRNLCYDNGTIIRDGNSLIIYRESQGACEWTQVCCSLTDKLPPKPEPVYVSRGCGYSNPRGLDITLTDTPEGEAQFGEFPWMVMVMGNVVSEKTVGFASVGGGSLLAPNVVLTAAHKVANIESVNLMVRAGEWDTRHLAEPYPHQDREVTTKILHEDFDPTRLFNDVALLILQTPFTLSKHIDTICLPQAWSYFDRSRCLVMGWGKKRADAPKYPHLLKKIDLPIVPFNKCQKNLRKTQLGRHFLLHSSFICAGGERGKDACLGDGGSPLVCPTTSYSNRYVLAGLVAWGLDQCGEENVPGVYADLKSKRAWIISTLESHSITLNRF